MKLNEIYNNDGAMKSRTRVGRGRSSGKGKTSGRGIKGQKSRTGVSINGFEGGQMPLYRRLPKRGFNNISRKEYQVINLDTLQIAIDSKKIDASKTIDAAVLKAAGVITKVKDGIRLLANGEIKTKVDLIVSGASESAQKAIEAAGGKVSFVEAPKPVHAEK